ncbi:hypothetical protein B0H16DRAFT_1722961 [Mycena metata]|uniref:F-box domain-containing protein n=1 Tax=Mycena metata TaxID=1033252 RepID=A0AAD7IZC5_9AGAR|nr:hypothetical protein B0H16DRAFT_1722961 [Mycena metata]
MDPERRFALEFVSRWTFTAKERPTWCLQRALIPIEIWTLILLDFCCFPRTGGFNAGRDYLRSLWEGLDVFVTGVAAFWTKLDVNFRSLSSTLVLDVKASKKLALDVRIDVRSDFADGEVDPDLDEEADHPRLRECLDVVRSVSLKWRSLRCQVNRELYLEVIREFLESSSAPALLSVDIQSAVADLRSDARVLRGVLPSLQRLRVCAFPISWMHTATFGSLTSLELRAISPLHYQSLAAFAALLERVSPTLQTLVIAGLGFCGTTPVLPPPFAMSVLEHVDLVFLYANPVQDNLIVSLLGIVELPALRSFRIENAGDDIAVHLATAVSHLKIVRTFCVSGGYVGTPSTKQLVEALPSLTHLDIQTAPHKFVDALFTLPQALPNLLVMQFEAFYAAPVLAYLLAREACGQTRLLEMRCVQYAGIPLLPSQVVAIGRLPLAATLFSYSELSRHG